MDPSNRKCDATKDYGLVSLQYLPLRLEAWGFYLQHILPGGQRKLDIPSISRVLFMPVQRGCNNPYLFDTHALGRPRFDPQSRPAWGGTLANAMENRN